MVFLSDGDDDDCESNLYKVSDLSGDISRHIRRGGCNSQICYALHALHLQVNLHNASLLCKLSDLQPQFSFHQRLYEERTVYLCRNLHSVRVCEFEQSR